MTFLYLWRMRIAVNTRFLIENKLEGIGWFTYEVLRRLVVQHPEQEFIFFFDRAYSEKFVFGENVTLVVLHPPARHPVLFVAWFEGAVVRALKRYRADVFLSPDNFCALRTSVPTVLVVHDLAFLHYPEQVRQVDLWYYRFFMPRFLRKAAQIVTVSQFTRGDIQKQYNVPPDKIRVACNGCRKTFKPLDSRAKFSIRKKQTEGQPYFFYIGAVHPRKNVARLIQAFDTFKKATHAPLKLLIAGRFSWQTGSVKAAYEKSGFQHDIQFLGYVSDAALPKLMGAAFALTYVSLFEGFGVPLLEAMHCEVPIISSTASSLPEVAGEAALLVDPTDIQAIATAMQQLYESETLREELVAEGRQQRQQFNWQSAADTVWEAMEQVCANRL